MPLISRINHSINNPKVDIAASENSLGFIDAFSIGIGGIVGGGIFATIGLAIVESRGATYLSFLIGGVVALLTAYSYLRLSVTYPSRGGTVKFINQAFGEGIFTGSLNEVHFYHFNVLLASLPIDWAELRNRWYIPFFI